MKKPRHVTTPEAPAKLRARFLLVLAVPAVALAAGIVASLRHEPPLPAPPVARAAAPTAPATVERELDDDDTPAAAPPALAQEPLRPSPPAYAEEDPIDALRSGLAAEDRATRIEAVEAVWRAGNVDALPVLEKVDLARDPDAAPTVIRAIAELAKSASPSARDDAAKTLDGWLDRERGRTTDDAAGNVSMLVEALGDSGGRDAALALAGALDEKDLPLYVETLAVQQIASLGDPRAEPAVARFAARVAALGDAEGVDGELRQEARAAAADALRRLTL